MRIVLCYPVSAENVEQIQAAAPDAEVVNAGQERIADELAAADVFCGHAKVPVDWPAAVAAGRLKWIQSSAAGMDHCLVPAVIADDSIVVTSCSGLFANQVAEQTLALLLGLVRSAPAFFRAQQRREFIRRPTGDLHGKTVGILGFGGNGRRLAEVLATFHCRIVATDKFPVNKPAHVDQLLPADQFATVLSQSDVVVLCVPLTEETTGMIDAAAVAAMQRHALLINVARGPVVREADLVVALDEGILAGAGLDVTEIEPLPTESRLWDMPNVIVTPHVGAQSAQRVNDTTNLFCQNLSRFQRGLTLINQVDKRLGFPVPEDTQG